MVLRVFLLGGFRVERDGQPIPTAAWQRSSARALVKLLATQPDHHLHREQIQEALWPDREPDAAYSALRKALYFARYALEPALAPGGRSSYLCADGEMLALDSERVWIDADAFERLAADAVAAGDVDAFERALAAYGGEMLPEDRYAEWSTPRREALAAQYTALLLDLAERLERAGADDQAITRLRQALERDPTNEEAHRRLMRLYALGGSRHQALRQYHLCRRALDEDLETVPDAATTRLYTDILAGRLARRAPGAHPLPAAIRRVPSGPLVGRARPLRLLLDDLAAPAGTPASGAAPRRGLVLLSGEAGIGKSRLAAEAARAAHARNAAVLWGAGHEQEGGVPYGPFVEALDGYVAAAPTAERRALVTRYPELARLLPSVPPDGQHGPAGGNPEAERARLFAAVARFLADLAAERPVLLVLDDLHAADDATLHLVHHLARAAPEQRWLVVGAYREEDVEAGSALQRLLADLARAGLARHIDLMRLARPDCDALIQSLWPDQPCDPAVLERVYALSRGNPLFAQEVARALRDAAAGAAERPAPPAEGAGVSRQVQALVEARVDRLGAEVRHTLALAATAGDTFSFAALRLAAADPASAGLSEGALLSALDRALAARILDEHEQGYAFRHPLFQAALYGRLSRQRRLHLHAALARAIEQTHPMDVEALARHYTRGGDEDKALVYLERAGDRAAALYADGVAEGYYQELLARLDRLGRCVDGARVREKLGAVLQAAGRLDEALAPLDAAAEILRQAADLEGWGRVTARIGWVYAWRGTPDDGVRRVQPLLAPLEAAGARRGLAALYAALAHLYFVSGRYEEQLTAAARAAELARVVDDTETLAVALCRHGVALHMAGRYTEALAAQEEAIAAAEAVGDLYTLRSALNNVAAQHMRAGELEQSRRYAERALAVAERLGDPAQIAFMAQGRGDLCWLMGDWEQAGVDYERAVALSSRDEESWAATYPLLGLGLLRLSQGAWADAVRYLEHGIGLAERSGDAQALLWGTGLLAWRDLLEGRPAEARARLLPVLDRHGRETPLVTLYIWPYVARADLELGDLEAAADAATQTVRRAAAQRMVVFLPTTLCVQALVAIRQGRWDEATSSLEEGLRLARRMPYPWAEAHVLCAYGEFHLAQGRPEPACERLEAALAIFQRLGARKDCEATERLLATVRHGSAHATG